VDAVLKHSQINHESDSVELVIVKDADRVVNMDVDLFARSGQHYANLPVIDYKFLYANPKATYREPLSVFRDIVYSLDWVDPTSNVCIRTATVCS